MHIKLHNFFHIGESSPTTFRNYINEHHQISAGQKKMSNYVLLNNNFVQCLQVLKISSLLTIINFGNQTSNIIVSGSRQHRKVSVSKMKQSMSVFKRIGSVLSWMFNARKMNLNTSLKTRCMFAAAPIAKYTISLIFLFQICLKNFECM